MRLTMDEYNREYEKAKVETAINSARLNERVEGFCHFCCMHIINEDVWVYKWRSEFTDRGEMCLHCAPNQEALRTVLIRSQKRKREMFDPWWKFW
jgi:hypothetical protein